MSRKRSKVIIASLILASAMAFLVIAGVKNTSMRHFTPDGLIADAAAVNNKGVQVDGLILEGSSKWDAAKFELTFAIRDREAKAKVDVIYANLKPDNFKDGGPVSVEGKYNAEQNRIVATKLQTKCASKYEAAASVTAQTDY
jgi:cytochrome c-type biogenesis protein CcmE